VHSDMRVYPHLSKSVQKSRHARISECKNQPHLLRYIRKNDREEINLIFTN